MWDDKSDNDDVTKIYVQYSPKGIQSIRFSYINSGKPIDGSLHGQSDNTYTQTVYEFRRDYILFFKYFTRILVVIFSPNFCSLR